MTRRITIPQPMKTAAVWLTAVFLAGSAFSIIFQTLYAGQSQPIPFSHRFHVTTKDLNCFFCHPNAANAPNPGMPPVDKCLLCHSVIAAKFRPIAKIRKYADAGKSIPWVRVSGVPDYVHFSHEPHIARGFDCSKCHGNIKAMDRVTLAHTFNMRFCVNCHKQNGASVSCYTCHY